MLEFSAPRAAERGLEPQLDHRAVRRCVYKLCLGAPCLGESRCPERPPANPRVDGGQPERRDARRADRLAATKPRRGLGLERVGPLEPHESRSASNSSTPSRRVTSPAAMASSASRSICCQRSVQNQAWLSGTATTFGFVVEEADRGRLDDLSQVFGGGNRSAFRR